MEFLILRLQGVMQAWGGHTYEDYRPTELFPTRSGLVGLLGACLGVDRADGASQDALSASFVYAARSDARPFAVQRITDYHTVLGARRVSGKASENPVQSYREYLCDAQFTVALEFRADATYGPDRVRASLDRPVFTPVLGRRSCPPSQPIFGGIVEAEDLHSALAKVPPGRGTIYSERKEGSRNRLRVRDLPIGGTRQFVTRDVFIHPDKEDDHVSQ